MNSSENGGQFVTSKLVYVLPEWRGKPVTKKVEMEESPKRIYHAEPTALHNGRAEKLSLSQNGFELLTHTHSCGNIDWSDSAAVRASYYPKMLSLAKDLTGAVEALPVYHMYRDGGQNAYSRHASHYTSFVHSDISPCIEWSGGCPESGGQAPWAAVADRQFAIINFWRPVGGTPIKNNHLAVLDAATLELSDIVPKEDVDEQDKSQHLRLIRNPEQRWYYFPEMMSNEVLAFTQYDTREASWAHALRPTFHSSFKDPTCPADAPARQSVEFRILCLFENEDGAERRRKQFTKQFPPLSPSFQQAQVPFLYHQQLAQNLGVDQVTAKL